jgi:hypothetical protein
MDEHNGSPRKVLTLLEVLPLVIVCAESVRNNQASKAVRRRER